MPPLNSIHAPHSQRADAAAELDPRAPHGGRQVQPGEMRPVQEEEAAGDDEGDEAEMGQHQEVGEQQIHAR